MTETAKHFPRIARDIGKEHFRGKVDRHEDEEDDD